MIEGEPPILIKDEVVNGGTHLRQHFKGELPSIGYPHEGWSGPETIVDKVLAYSSFDVVDPKAPETHHQAFERVVGKAVYNVLVMTGIGDDTNETYLEAAHDMSVLRDEWDRRFNGSLEMIVHDRILALQDTTP